MTWEWNTGFEARPSGSDFGSVSLQAMRDLEGAFKERFGQDHVFDESATPLCYHKAGLCSVVGISEGSLASNLVEGALQYSEEDGLKRDTGAGMEAAAPSSHLGLIGVGDVEEDHPQYVPLIPAAGYVSVTGDIEMASSYKVTGLPSDVGGGEPDEEVLSRGMHLGDAVAGGAKHNDGVVTLAGAFTDGIKLGLGKFSITKRSGVYSAGDISFDNYASFPVFDSGTVSTYVYGHSGVNSNDYTGRLRLQHSGSQTLRWIRFDV
jgi:hypothetical protein